MRRSVAAPSGAATIAHHPTFWADSNVGNACSHDCRAPCGVLARIEMSNSLALISIPTDPKKLPSVVIISSHQRQRLFELLFDFKQEWGIINLHMVLCRRANKKHLAAPAESCTKSNIIHPQIRLSRSLDRCGRKNT
jgi:hypothetical protein